MTKIKVNEMLESMSGTYGKKHVFRTFAGKTVLTRRPNISSEESEEQLAHRKRCS